MSSAYTEVQLGAYVATVGLHSIKTLPPPTASFLEKLHVHQISSIPYENLSLHYSPTKSNSLDPVTLFKKVTSRHRRGGYCFELTVFFKQILLGFGFQVYTAAATIRLRNGMVPQGPYIGYYHVVNIVSFGDEKFMVDVSFGGDGATRPLRLKYDRPQRNLGGQDVRLIRQAIEDGGEEFWIYQYRIDDGEWNSYYAFQEKESSVEEIKRRNEWISLDEDSFQRKTILVVKFLRDESLNQNPSDVVKHVRAAETPHALRATETYTPVIVGKVMMIDNVVKRNLGGKTEIVETCETEAQRVEALKEWFDLTLTKDQIESIRGNGPEIK